MFSYFKYPKIMKTAQQGIKNPDEFVSSTSITFLSTFFIMSILILGLLTGLFLFSGFYFDILFLKIMGFFSFILFCGIFILFRYLKKIIRRTARNIKTHLETKFSEYNTNNNIRKIIDVENQSYEK